MQCMYDVLCPLCTYGDARVVDEVIQNLPDSLHTQQGRILNIGHDVVPRRCLPGCSKHCCMLSAGLLPSFMGSLLGCATEVHNPGLYWLFQCIGVTWVTVIGGQNRHRLRKRYRINQPQCTILGFSFEPCEPFCCWFCCPLVCAQEARFVRRKFDVSARTSPESTELRDYIATEPQRSDDSMRAGQS